MRSVVPSQADRLIDSMPSVIVSDFPLFYKFMRYYFEWKHRNGGFNEADIEHISDALDIDRTTYSGHLDIISLSHLRQSAVDMARDYLLERHSDMVESSDEFIFLTNDNEILNADGTNSDSVDQVIASKGSGLLAGDSYSLDGVDGIMWARLLPHIQEAKGTLRATELFFKAAYGENIADNKDSDGNHFSYPSTQILMLDHDTFVDGEASMRDDEYYNEYSVVINTKHEREYYEPLLTEVYMRQFHASGFNLFLKQVSDD